MDNKYSGYNQKYEGVMLTGFRTIKGRLYYLTDENWAGYRDYLRGTMRTGWNTIGGKRYYMNKRGVIQRGLVRIDGSVYYFDKKGIMRTGMQVLGNNCKYYFSSNGKMYTGWKQLGEKKYYFCNNGKAYANTDATINGYRYRFAKDGSLAKMINCHLDSKGNPVTGWHNLNGKIYYARSDGELVSGSVTIDGRRYVFETKQHGCALRSGTPPRSASSGISVSRKPMGAAVPAGTEQTNTDIPQERQTTSEPIVTDDTAQNVFENKESTAGEITDITEEDINITE